MQSVLVQVEVVHAPTSATLGGAVSALFREPCDGCHAHPAAGLRGQPLYDAVCAMCHGVEGRGGSANALAGLQPTLIASVTANGAPEAGMPGFAAAHRGPLDAEQVRSLVRYLAKP